MVEIQSHLVTLQKGKLKADVSYITDHIQSPKAYLIRSKHEVTTCYSGMKKCTGRKEEEEKFLPTVFTRLPNLHWACSHLLTSQQGQEITYSVVGAFGILH